MLFSCACFPSDAILPGQEAGGTRRRYHLKVRNIIFLVNQLTLRGLYGKSTNWSLVGAAVQRLSRLRNFTIGFKYQSTMEEFTLKETDAFEPLVQSERLSFAYLADISANPTTKWLADENDTWILVDAKSLQATGVSYFLHRATPGLTELPSGLVWQEGHSNTSWIVRVGLAPVPRPSGPSEG